MQKKYQNLVWSVCMFSDLVACVFGSVSCAGVILSSWCDTGIQQVRGIGWGTGTGHDSLLDAFVQGEYRAGSNKTINKNGIK